MKTCLALVRRSKPVILAAACLLLAGVRPSYGQRPHNQKKPASPAAFYSNAYPNLLRQAGYGQADIDRKVAQAYHDVFEGPNKVYFAVGDSLAYVSDVKNEDARTEGMSYGMMVAVQLDRKEVFDRLWALVEEVFAAPERPVGRLFCLEHQSRHPEAQRRRAGFGWRAVLRYQPLVCLEPLGQQHWHQLLPGSPPHSGCLLEKGRYRRRAQPLQHPAQANQLRAGGDMYNWTDPSYHVPAFLDVWAEYARDGHEQFYRDCADTARVFLHRACAAPTGLNYDYTEFSGRPHATRWAPPAFRYDSWRVPMNIAMDNVWFGKDRAWQQQYAQRFQGFLRGKGLNTFEDQFNVDGSRPDFILPAGKVKKLRHSLGLVATSAAASLMSPDANRLNFVHALWNARLAPYDDGYFDPYYDGLLYLFSLMHLSGKYQAIKPQTH